MNSIPDASPEDKSNMEIFYSPYGYIYVDKAELQTLSQMVKFKKENAFSGTINVKSFFLIF